MIFVDSCVLIDIFNDDDQWKSWSVDQITRALPRGLCINAVVYAEVSGSFATQQDVSAAIKQGRLEVKGIPVEAAYLAADAFKRYRKNKGQFRTALPDFFIGAHAQVLSCPILTRDTQRFSTYFPDVELIAPDPR
jgi:predicted nucleic acid-binding protein